MRSFVELEQAALERGPRTVAVVGAGSASSLAALDGAVAAGLAVPVLVGDGAAAREVVERNGLASLHDASVENVPDQDAAARAAAMAGAGDVDVLLKGSLRTDELLRAVLDRQHGLRTDRLLSDVLLYEDTLSGASRLVGVTDGGINVAPDPEQKRQIVANAIAVFRALGFERPRVALMSATEVVTEAIQSTVEWHDLARLAATLHDPEDLLAHADIQGPLALDNALIESAARAKGITGPVAGRADIMVVANIEAGNILGKAVKYLAGSITAHVVAGARVPVLIPSRVESAEDKRMSIALGVLVYDAVRQ